MYTILIADDDPINRRIIERSLDGLPAQFVTAGDGLEALTRALEHAPDLAIVDALMPRLDGWSVCRALRGDPLTRGTELLMLSGLGDPCEETGRAAGADRFLAKPFSPHDLAAVARELLERGRGRPS